MNLIEVHNGTRVKLDDEAVARLAAAVLAAEGVSGAELAIEFVGERRIRQLNREHRGLDEVTDVLSFPLEDAGEAPPAGGPGLDGDPLGPPRLLGDVVVCARQALRQARADGLPPAFELSLLIVHGTLHVLGHDHEVDAGQMALRQAELLDQLDWEAVLA